MSSKKKLPGKRLVSALKISITVVLSIFFILLITVCHPDKDNNGLYQQQLFSFGTLIDISILSDEPEQAKQAINIISTEFDQLHAHWHPWQNGALGQINKKFSSSNFFSSTSSIIKLIQDSKQLSEQSNGLFNPAIGQLIKLWQFDQLENEQYQFKLPDAEKIQTLIQQNPQMQDIAIDKSQIKSDNSSVVLDFGAFAKGAAIEQMIHILKERNINNALINAGGDLKVIGSKNGKAWRIGIKNPANAHDPSAKSIIAAISLNNNEALFTSGNYERFFEFEGQHYHHIIDPRSGYPARGTQSVTVLSNDAALADAASTALFIAGPELWPEIAKKMGIQYVMLMSDDNKIYLSPAMAERIELFTDIKPIIIK